MSQPSQEFPPWLSPSVITITDAAGNPVATETTIVYIPPTYFGPSIPLGSLYIFGGTTEPPSIALPSSPQTTATVPPSITTIATPTTTTILTTSATPTTSAIPTTSALSLSTSASITSATPTSIISVTSSSSSSSVSLSSSSISSSFTTSSSVSFSSPSSILPSASATSSAPTSTNVPQPIHASGLTRGQLVGVIVASILGLIFLFVLALFLFLFLKARRNRRHFTTLTPIDEDYYIIPPGSRPPGEGSPRHSGEEADPFLQQSSVAGYSGGLAAAGAGMGMGAAAMTQIPSQVTSRNGSSRVQPPPIPTTGSNSSGSTNSNASGFGVLLDRPSLGYLPSMPEHQETGGTPLSPSDMARIGRESVLPDNADQYGDEEYAGPYAYSQDPQVPPRLVDSTPTTPLLGGDRPPVTSQPSKLSNKSSIGPSDPEEAATLLTARRVKVEDLGPRVTLHNSSPAGPSTGFLGALGLGGLASNIGRLSWFKNLDSPRSSVNTPNYVVDPLSEKDIETGRSLLSPDSRQVDSFGNRPRGVGTGTDGTRPISSVSARSGASGGTMYHDAQSSLPGTPLLAPPPRAVTPAAPLPTEHDWLTSPLASPPAYSGSLFSTSTPPPPGSPEGANLSNITAADILDMPAPAALDHFSTITSSKDTPTSSSFGSKSPKFLPPGLETIKPVGWANTATEAPKGSVVGLSSGIEHQGPISIDILEEAPPDAEQGWRTISSSGSGADPSRRGTFGMFMHGPGFSSEQASIHSMRSHFTPSNRSTGSAPASHDMGSIGSNSSRPSAHSVARSIGSGVSAAAHSLLRTGSISSDDRMRFSPPHSAFGSHQQRTSSGQGSQEPPLSPVIGSPPSAHMSPDKSTTIRSVGSGSATILDTSFETMRAGLQHERSISPSNTSFSMNPPWAGGLSSEWQASV